MFNFQIYLVNLKVEQTNCNMVIKRLISLLFMKKLFTGILNFGKHKLD